MTTKELTFRLTPSCTATKHGTANAYTTYRCRCATAREAWRLYNKRRREGRNEPNCIDSTGSARRIRALIAIGWSMRELARRTGHHHRTIQDVVYGRRRLITRHTARWVSDLYEELSTTPGGSKYALLVADRYGWAPPLAWDEGAIDDPTAEPDLGGDNPDFIDPIAVEKALAGHHVRLTPAERDHTFRVGLDRGMTPYAIGQALHMSASTYKGIAKRVLAEQAA